MLQGNPIEALSDQLLDAHSLVGVQTVMEEEARPRSSQGEGHEFTRVHGWRGNSSTLEPTFGIDEDVTDSGAATLGEVRHAEDSAKRLSWSAETHASMTPSRSPSRIWSRLCDL